MYHEDPDYVQNGVFLTEWLDVSFINREDFTAYNASAVISCVPDSTKVYDGSVYLGNMPPGEAVWSKDYFTIEIDTSTATSSEGICWDVTYYDETNTKKYVISFVAKFCDETCAEICKPTLIELSYFAAQADDGFVTLSWETASEIDNAGFNLYRSESPSGEYVKINSFLIPAVGSPTEGASYEYNDTGVKNREAYYYKLEDIDLNGTSSLHGPVQATPRRVYSIKKIFR
jgi:hypothetical protein